ncbi:MAG: orotidine-5'-phosphate decarboxylase [Candidatus Aegiribacteria sp.]|nr:orotidine-5'-phosphate decarboxylase [Candidatus Aegiribacteria sp.]MBD3295358.1 orotidine-5'-phosphate decarboxylase [Candidatus Fermentibacteria bacterium]
MLDIELYVAVTSREIHQDGDFLRKLAGLPLGLKVGLELFVKEGPELMKRLKEAGYPLFLDLKFHDIPHTAAGAVRSACRYEPRLLNVHASGGFAMMKAAAEAVTGDTRLLAVTVLTSLSAEDLELTGFRGEPQELVVSMALKAKEAGVHGVVCSPLEAGPVREAVGDDFVIVTPGIRPSGVDVNDQKRTATPFDAVKAGANALVVGRPITLAENPRMAAESLLSEINLAREGR